MHTYRRAHGEDHQGVEEVRRKSRDRRPLERPLRRPTQRRERKTI